MRDLPAVGIALGQILLDRRFPDHIGGSVKHHRFAQVDSEIPGEVGRRSIQGRDHYGDRRQVVEDGSDDRGRDSGARNRFPPFTQKIKIVEIIPNIQIIPIVQIIPNIIQIVPNIQIIPNIGPVGFHVLPSVFSTRR